MKMPFGKYRGMPMDQLPYDYLQWLVDNIDACDVRDEARFILNSKNTRLYNQYKLLEERANEILGEKPIENLPRRYIRRRK
ncbi:MAG: DUF3820 family protein [Nitrososphaerales archaeon]